MYFIFLVYRRGPEHLLYPSPKMEQSYFSRVPRDVLNLLTETLPYDELYQAYISLPEMRSLDDPAHPVWKRLYHRDISSYPLPEGVSYRDQYFWAMEFLSRNRVPRLLAELGYDIPLSSMYGPMAEYTQEAVLEKAAKKGYITIVRNVINSKYLQTKWGQSNILNATLIGGPHLDIFDLIYNTFNPTFNTNWLYIAAYHGDLQVLNHLLDLNPHPLSVDDVNAVMYYAAESGDQDTIQRAIDLGGRNDQGLGGAVVGGHLELAKWFQQRGANVTTHTRGLAAMTTKIKGFWGTNLNPDCQLEVFKWVVDQTGVDYDTLIILSEGVCPELLDLGVRMFLENGETLKRKQWGYLLENALGHISCRSYEMAKTFLTRPEINFRNDTVVDALSDKVSDMLKSNDVDYNNPNCSRKLFRMLYNYKPITNSDALKIIHELPTTEVELFELVFGGREWSRKDLSKLLTRELHKLSLFEGYPVQRPAESSLDLLLQQPGFNEWGLPVLRKYAATQTPYLTQPAKDALTQLGY